MRELNILFYSILFYSILFYSILFYSCNYDILDLRIFEKTVKTVGIIDVSVYTYIRAQTRHMPAQWDTGVVHSAFVGGEGEHYPPGSAFTAAGVDTMYNRHTRAI